MAYDDKPAGNAPDFVYTLYIAAPIETVWNGLIQQEVTETYWGHHNKSDWKIGSKWEHLRSSDTNVVDVHGQVLESDPPNKLVITWNGINGSKTEEPAPSVVTYELVALGPDTKLTVTHSQLTQDSVMHTGVTQGWPAVLSNLKSVLETGNPLSDDQWGDAGHDHTAQSDETVTGQPTSMHSLRLNQVTLGSIDMAASVSFYKRLGLILIVDSAPRYVRFEFPTPPDGGDPATLSLHSVQDGWIAPTDWPLIYFEVDDVSAYLTTADLTPLAPPEMKPYDWEEADVLDPAGNRIRIFKAGKARRFPDWRL